MIDEDYEMIKCRPPVRYKGMVRQLVFITTNPIIELKRSCEIETEFWAKCAIRKGVI